MTATPSNRDFPLFDTIGKTWFRPSIVQAHVLLVHNRSENLRFKHMIQSLPFSREISSKHVSVLMFRVDVEQSNSEVEIETAQH